MHSCKDAIVTVLSHFLKMNGSCANNK
uniref:Uncharacterized protein n=1 Tax=Arundo donax TaxID=35708 RepID=A0A0A9AN33_ARUDO